MADDTKVPFGTGDSPADESFQSAHLTKQEFARRLYRMTLRRGWTQSELARQTGIARDSISTYVRAIAFPGPSNLQKLADALDVAPNDLLPNALSDGTSAASLEMKVSQNPEISWLRVNRAVSTTTAIKVIELINSDKPPDQES